MTPEERIALVRELSATIPVPYGAEPMSPDEAVRVYLNGKGEWRTWEDENPDYVDDGAAQCCEACSMPMKEGFVSEDAGPWCSPACMWGDDDREVITWDFALLGDAVFWTDWEELDEDEEPYLLPKGDA
mgnify:FL=1